MGTVGFSRSTAFCVQKHPSDEENTSLMSRGPPVNEKLDGKCLEARRSFETTPTMGMRKMALHKGMDENMMSITIQSSSFEWPVQSTSFTE